MQKNRNRKLYNITVCHRRLIEKRIVIQERLSNSKPSKTSYTIQIYVIMVNSIGTISRILSQLKMNPFPIFDKRLIVMVHSLIT